MITHSSNCSELSAMDHHLCDGHGRRGGKEAALLHNIRNDLPPPPLGIGLGFFGPKVLFVLLASGGWESYPAEALG